MSPGPLLFLMTSWRAFIISHKRIEARVYKRVAKFELDGLLPGDAALAYTGTLISFFCHWSTCVYL